MSQHRFYCGMPDSRRVRACTHVIPRANTRRACKHAPYVMFPRMALALVALIALATLAGQAWGAKPIDAPASTHPLDRLQVYHPLAGSSYAAAITDPVIASCWNCSWIKWRSRPPSVRWSECGSSPPIPRKSPGGRRS